jgi:murein DD-endopeptidase MepM/ murein hydrolase activator NlpD
MAELHMSGFENMAFELDGVSLGTATSAGGKCFDPSNVFIDGSVHECKCGVNGVWDANSGTCAIGTQTNNVWQGSWGCEMGKVVKTFTNLNSFSTSGWPSISLGSGSHEFKITFDSGDGAFHVDAHYIVKLVLEETYTGADPTSFFTVIPGAEPCCQVHEPSVDIYTPDDTGAWYYRGVDTVNGVPAYGVTIDPGGAWQGSLPLKPDGTCSDLNLDACITWIDPDTNAIVNEQTTTCGWSQPWAGAVQATNPQHMTFTPLQTQIPESPSPLWISVCQGTCPCACNPPMTTTTTEAPPTTTTPAPDECICYKHKIASITGDTLVFEPSSNSALGNGGHTLGQWENNKVPAGARVCKDKPNSCETVESQRRETIDENQIVELRCTQMDQGTCAQPYTLSAQSGESADIVLNSFFPSTWDYPFAPETVKVHNLNGQFVWDRDGDQEHTFTSAGESFVHSFGGWNYSITFDGSSGGLSFTILGTMPPIPTTTTPAPVLIFNSQECLKTGEVHCLSYVNDSCSKKVVGDVKVTKVIVNDIDTDDWVTVEPLCDSSLFDNLENGIKIHLCKGPCSPSSKDTFVATVSPGSCALNGDQWIKVDAEGKIINFYKKENNTWAQQDLTNPCALNVTPATTTTQEPSLISITGLSALYVDVNDIIQNAPDLEVNITGTAHNHWHWRMNSPVEGGTNAVGEFMVGENITKATNWINAAGIEAGTHTVHVALVNNNHELLSPSVTDSFQFIIGEMSYVDGWIPDWMGPRYYESTGDITDNDISMVQAVGRGNAWNAPIAAANQLGHLVGLGLTKPTKADGHEDGINDGFPTESTTNNHPDTWFGSSEHGQSGVGTKVWGAEHGWGDYLIDDLGVRWSLGTCSDQVLHSVNYDETDQGQVVWKTEAECMCGELGGSVTEWNGTQCVDRDDNSHTPSAETGNTWFPYRPPQYQYDPNVTGGSSGLTDFGWFMNTNNSSEDRAATGMRANAGIINIHPHSDGVASRVSNRFYGTSVDNIYKGLKDFYRHAGYTNLADDETQKSVGIVHHRTNDNNDWVNPKGKLPQHWDDNGKSYTDSTGVINPEDSTTYEQNKQFAWETIRKEIDNNRTVIAVLQGFHAAGNLVSGPSGMTHPTGFPNTLHSIEKDRTDQVQTDAGQSVTGWDGTGFYGINSDITAVSDPSSSGFFAKAVDETALTPSNWEVAGQEHWSGNAVGYAVLIVGYIPRNSAADPSLEPTGSGNGGTDWLIVRDGRTNTQRNMIIPYDSADKNTTGANTNVITDRWASDILMATIYLNLKDSTTGTWIEPTKSYAPVACDSECASSSKSETTTQGGNEQQVFHYDTLSQSGCEKGSLSIEIGPEMIPDWVSVIHHDTTNIVNGIEEGYHTGRTDSNGQKIKLTDALASDAVLLDDFVAGTWNTYCAHAPTEDYRGVNPGSLITYQYDIDNSTEHEGYRYITVIVNWNDTCVPSDGWSIDVSYKGTQQCITATTTTTTTGDPNQGWAAGYGGDFWGGNPSTKKLAWPVPANHTKVTFIDPDWTGGGDDDYSGHRGIDIGFHANVPRSEHFADMVNNPVNVYAAASGKVIEVVDVYDDQCTACGTSTWLPVSEDALYNPGGTLCSDISDSTGTNPGSPCPNYVIIDHGYATLGQLGFRYTDYVHLAKNSASHLVKGAQIQKGDLIGKVGSSGRSCGAHLHLQVAKRLWNYGVAVPTGCGQTSIQTDMGQCVDPFLSNLTFGNPTGENVQFLGGKERWEDQCFLPIYNSNTPSGNVPPKLPTCPQADSTPTTTTGAPDATTTNAPGTTTTAPPGYSPASDNYYGYY